ncbi:transcription elongation factor A protein-like 4 [Suncus etruscus]|uniref:transcription elongation factor A protein-like 4 n=1 Tax=Suncus etruscus TaxID=109475 RepID=UPI00210FAC76|nr:transcription elongation factor A protein-like 4 [Suncus etruscus]
MEKNYSENEGKCENKGKMELVQRPVSVIRKVRVCTRDDMETLKNERKTENDEILMEKEKVDYEAKQRQQMPEGERKSENKEETTEERPTNEPRAAEKRPSEDDVPRKVKRKTKGLSQCLKEHKEAIHNKHLSNEEMIKEFDKMAWVEDEVKKTRLKLGRFMCMHKTSEDTSGSWGPNENRGDCMAPQRGFEDTSFM